MLKFFFGLLFTFLFTIGNAQNYNYEIFDNYFVNTKANSIRFFLQDSLGIMWVGTNNGLYSFDGYTFFPHNNSEFRINNLVNCGLFYNDGSILLGYETGLMLYDIKKDKYSTFIPGFEKDVRALVKTENELWMGCAEGLYVYDLESGEIRELLIDEKKGLKHKMIYALLEDDGFIYLGSSNTFGRYSQESKEYELLGYSAESSSFYVNSLLKDESRNCIWVGRGLGLLKFTPESGRMENVGEFDVVKSMVLDDENNVLMGTDNGFCIYNEKEIKRVVHDSREENSLANNVVWSVFKDQSGNVWLGTDNGISLHPQFRRITNIPIHKITGTGEGNQFYSFLRDSLNNFWLGGTNGLIKIENGFGESTESIWHRMSGSPYNISHNRIRDVFEDEDHHLWVATDYGLNRYDRKTQQFIRYEINAPNGTQNANWTYDLLSDDYGRLWIATFKDGIFVIEKKELFEDSLTQIADLHYSTENGLSGNNIDFIVPDRNENIWALVHHLALDIINTRTGDITNFPVKDFTEGQIPSFLLTDSEGFVWAGYRNGALKINPDNKNVENVPLTGSDRADVLAMAEVENEIWISTTEGIWTIDKEKLTTQHINFTDQYYTGIYYDHVIKSVVLGGVDAFALVNPDVKFEAESGKIRVSALSINNQPLLKDRNSLDFRYINEISLAHNQNNIEIDITDLTYTEENKGAFKYKINDAEEWTIIPPGDNKIQLNKLSPNTYQLFFSKLKEKSKREQSLSNFTIEINPAWYESLFAKIIYVLLTLSFAWWVYYFVKTKNRMKYERLEKEKSLEQSKLKIAFFSDVAHEFKTPLSLIIAPMSRLIQGAKNEKDRSALEMVQQNAMKLNSLIHQAIDYYRDDSKVNIGLLLSKVELVEFSRSIFLAYEESMKDKNIDFIFNTNINQIPVDIDTVKIESVINNLLSNACKFVGSGDSIIFSIEYHSHESIVEMKVSDTGIGIPKADIPYIFQRFFQSKNNSKNHKGTGIGLFLVKNYVELHGGEVKAISDPEEGTTISFLLPVIESDYEVRKIEPENKDENNEKQLIVIVEDNLAIADLIYNSFISEYRCIIANNGKTGLKICSELKPDLIIADVMMPVMDGLEMARRLKKNANTATIPLVFLTAKDDKETELQSIQLNIEAFIAKPFDSSILYSRVNQILENRKLLEKKARIDQIASPKFEDKESQDEKFLAKITKLIEDNIAEPDLNVNMLCDLAGVSSKHLYRKMKQLSGMTTVDYIKSIRMKKAAMYLSNKNFTVSEVMFMVGFSNHSYFAKCFQAKFGIAPRQYSDQFSRDT